MAKHKINHFDLVLFWAGRNFVFYISLFFAIWYKKEEQNMWQITIISYLISLVFLLIIPKNKGIHLKDILSNVGMRIAIFVESACSFILLVYFVCYELSFYYLTFIVPWLILVLLSVLLFVFCIFGVDKIFCVSTMFFMVGIVLILVPFIFDVKQINYDLILPVKLVSFHKEYFLLIYIPLHNFISFIYSDYYEPKINIKLSWILSQSIFYFLMLIGCIFTIGIFGGKLLRDVPHAGYFIYRISTQNQYFGTLDIVLIFFLLCAFFIEGGYLLETMRISLKMRKKSLWYISLVGILLIPCYLLLYNKIFISLYLLLAICIISSIIFIILYYFLEWRNRKYARKLVE